MAQLQPDEQRRLADGMRSFTDNLKCVTLCGRGGGGGLCVMLFTRGASCLYRAVQAAGSIRPALRRPDRLPAKPLTVQSFLCRAFLEAKGAGEGGTLLVTKDMMDEFAAQMRTAAKAQPRR